MRSGRARERRDREERGGGAGEVGVGGGGGEGGVWVRVTGVRFIQNNHIYEYGYDWGRKWVTRHDSGGIRNEI